MKFLKDKNIYLAPKNNFTVDFENELKSLDIFLKGYLDNFKKDNDIVKKNSFEANDVVIVFSPNHYKEIVSNLNTDNIYVLNVVNNEFALESLDKFDGYKTIPKLNFNKLNIQRYHWDNHLKNFLEKNGFIDKYGYEWGDPENSNDELGDYLSINKKLNSIIDNTTHVLEIGTLGGKWTKYMLDAKHITCVDINDSFIDVIKKRFYKHIHKFNFYVSKGNELKDIQDNSIDLVFCMDTLVRVEKEYIFDYVKEVSRVLKKDGKAIIHLPNTDIKDCSDRCFTQLTTDEIHNKFSKYFINFILDSKTIVHGTLVYINC